MWVVILMTNCQGKKEGEDVLMFVRDCTKFVGNFSGIIEKSTPHLYLSALPFALSKSMMPGQLLDRFPGIAKVIVGQHYDWPRSQQVLQVHKAEVTKVASSVGGGHAVPGPVNRITKLGDVSTVDQVIIPPPMAYSFSQLSCILTRWKTHCFRLRQWDNSTLGCTNRWPDGKPSPRAHFFGQHQVSCIVTRWKAYCVRIK